MTARALLAAVGVWLALGVPTLAHRAAEPADGSSFRLYSVASAGDISPNAAEVAFFTPTTDWDPKRDPNHWPTIMSTFNYRRNEIAASAAGTPTSKVFPKGVMLHGFIRFSPDGRFVLGHDGEGVVHIFLFEGHSGREVKTINLGLSADRPSFQPVDIEWSPDGTRIAVILSFKIFHEGVVRVYDVSSGKMEWERDFNLVEMGGEAWGPDGKRLAVTLLSGEPHSDYPPRDIPNLLVLNAGSGRTLLMIDTGDQAGPVCFAPDNTLVTAPLHFELRGRDSAHPEEAKVWDATTGRLIREIASPGRDIHDDLALSRDGKVLLAYVGKERAGFSFHAMEYTSNVVDRKFQLFDYETGRVIATSPDLGCAAGWFAPALRIGPHGKRVLVCWPHLMCSPSVFELQ